MMTTLLITVMMMVLTLGGLVYEASTARRIMGVTEPWSTEAVFLLVGLAVFFPLGLIYVWGLAKRNYLLREHIARQKERDNEWM